MKAVILADGEFPTNPHLLNLLKNNFIAACDGAVYNLDKINIKPNIIVGDLDGISNKLKNKYQDKIIHIKEQNTNDLSKTFFYCLKLGFDDFIILGATGKREDHTIANIALLPKLAKECKYIIMKSDYGEFSIYKTPCKVNSIKGEQISIFCFDKNAKLISKGLKYSLSSISLDYLYSGTLNEAIDDYFHISSNIPTELIIYKAY